MSGSQFDDQNNPANEQEEVYDAQAVPPPSPVATIQLDLAPVAKSTNRRPIVIACGLFTTALALLGVFALEKYAEFDLMLFFVRLILPAGAMIAGAVAASGYALMSYWLGVKIRREFLWLVCGLLLASYFAAHYVSYLTTGPYQAYASTPWGERIDESQAPANPSIRDRGFLEVYHLKSTNMTWSDRRSSSSSRDKTAPTQLGSWGYAFILLGIVGFVGTGLLILKAVGAGEYCDLCEQYMKAKVRCTWPASLPAKKFKKKDAAEELAYNAESEQVNKMAMERAEELKKRISAGDANGINQLLVEKSTLSAKQLKALPMRIEVKQCKCGKCHSGWILSQVAIRAGDKIQYVEISKVEVAPVLARAIETVA